jgi:hypothetical protein
MLSVIMLSVFMLNVVMLSDVAPENAPKEQFEGQCVFRVQGKLRGCKNAIKMHQKWDVSMNLKTLQMPSISSYLQSMAKEVKVRLGRIYENCKDSRG